MAEGAGGTRRASVSLVAALSLLAASCGGGGGGAPSATTPATPAAPVAAYPVPAQESLTSAEVGRVVAQAAAEATARALPSVIAVTDRVGNVLAVFTMPGARAMAAAPIPPGTPGIDVQGVTFPATMAAISKAVTAAYLSSGGNAFSTRTASMIVQEHFPPAPTTAGLESGPLFGVQFSQLPCSDLSARYLPAGGAAAMIGPKRSPLGLSADAGGLPLYKNGVVVGAIGVMGDGVYGADENVLDVDDDAEEAIALAGTIGLEAPEAIRADRITVDGTLLRFSDATPASLRSNPASAPALAATPGALTPVRGYYAESGAPALLAGQAYGTEASGIRASTTAEFANPDAFVLTNGAGANRFPIVGATDAGDVAQPLTATEVRAVLEEAFRVMTRARGQIRRPLDSRAQVSIAVVDTRGSALGLVRGPDAPIFGTDVALQKARTAAFFSGARAGSDLLANVSGDVRTFVPNLRAFLNDPTALTGAVAFSDRAVGNLSRPYFPDGEVARPNGPLSRPIVQFNPFSTGLQSALILGNLAQHIGYVAAGGADTPQRCTSLPDPGTGRPRIANGIQIFPGSVPIYRGGTLVGAIGVSGDGIDQDDMISFLGLHNAGVRLGTIANAPEALRSDKVVVRLPDADVRLRYISCPFAPFLDTNDQNVCQGK